MAARMYNPARLRSLFERFRYSKPERDKRYQRLYGYSHEVGRVYRAAQEKYHLTAQPLKVHVFRNTEPLYYVEDFDYLGWRGVAQAGVVVHDIPGNHFNLFSAPNDRACAQAVQQALGACQ